MFLALATMIVYAFPGCKLKEEPLSVQALWLQVGGIWIWAWPGPGLAGVMVGPLHMIRAYWLPFMSLT